MRSFRRFVPVLSVALAMPVAQALQAQGAQDTQRPQNEPTAQPAPNAAVAQPTQPTATTAGPTLTNATVGVRVTRAEPAKAPPKFAETRHNQTLMIVGGAALIVGAIIGDTPGTIIMIGGAGIGLYGLYKYLE